MTTLDSPVCYTPDEPLYAASGWTCRNGIWPQLAPFFDERRYGVGVPFFDNTVICERAVLLQLSLQQNQPVEDFVPLFGIDAQTAVELLASLPAAALKDRQNHAPGLESLLQACAASQDQVLLGGYGIGPQRADERLSIDTLWVDTELLDQPNYFLDAPAELIWQVIWEPVRQHFFLDSECAPDEISLAQLPTGRLGWRMWWD